MIDLGEWDDFDTDEFYPDDEPIDDLGDYDLRKYEADDDD